MYKDIDKLFINIFEEQLGTISQNLANELKKIIQVECKIGKDYIIDAAFSPEKRGKPKSGGIDNKISLALNSLEHNLRALKREQYFLILETLLEANDEQADNIHELFYAISMVLLRYINSQKLIDKIAKRISLYKLTQSNELSNPAETAEYIRSLSEIIFNSVKEQEKLRAKKIVDALMQFIHENLHEDLSLTKLAEKVNYSPAYLSRLFKQESGINPSDFILNARIEMAKELLIGGRLQVNQIAKRVGYASSHSFTRTFKNITGFSPQEYKNNKIQNNKEKGCSLQKVNLIEKKG